MRMWTWTESVGATRNPPRTRGALPRQELGRPARPALVVCGGPDDGATIPIDKPIIMAGHLPDNDVVLEGPGISRRHAEIVATDTGYYLRDLGPANRTYVNTHEIGETEYLLGDGDQIRLGDSRVSLVFRDPESAAIEATPIAFEDAAVDTSPASLEPEAQASLDAPAEDIQSAEGAEEADGPTPAEDGLYEGTVRLNVEAAGDIPLMVHFIQELRLKPEVRVLRFVTNARKDVDLWLRLREPLPLQEMLAEMRLVAHVRPDSDTGPSPADGERVVKARLIS